MSTKLQEILRIHSKSRATVRVIVLEGVNRVVDDFHRSSRSFEQVLIGMNNSAETHVSPQAVEAMEHCVLEAVRQCEVAAKVREDSHFQE